jgi:hypothetical protein
VPGSDSAHCRRMCSRTLRRSRRTSKSPCSGCK